MKTPQQIFNEYEADAAELKRIYLEQVGIAVQATFHVESKWIYRPYADNRIQYTVTVTGLITGEPERVCIQQVFEGGRVSGDIVHFRKLEPVPKPNENGNVK